jgi:hypothetical protein
MSLPPLWTPLTMGSRNKLNNLFTAFKVKEFKEFKEINDSTGKISQSGPQLSIQKTQTEINDNEEKAWEEETRKSVDIELLHYLKAEGASDQDLILIGAAMLSNK